MIEKITVDIDQSLKSNCYLAALALALTLPDICGKAEYPHEKSSKTRYIDWYQKNIGYYEKDISISETPELADLPYMSGELLYQLRCSFLHSGDTDIDVDQIHEPQNKLTRFTLEIRESDDLLASSSSANLRYNQVGEVEEREFEVGIVRICKILSAVALKYYRENSEKFTFFSYNIVDRRTSKTEVEGD